MSLGFPGGASGKRPPCQCKLDVRDTGLILGSGRSPGGGHNNHDWRIPRTEEPGRLQSIGSRGAGCDWRNSAYTQTHMHIIYLTFLKIPLGLLGFLHTHKHTHTHTAFSIHPYSYFYQCYLIFFTWNKDSMPSFQPERLPVFLTGNVFQQQMISFCLSRNVLPLP